MSAHFLAFLLKAIKKGTFLRIFTLRKVYFLKISTLNDYKRSYMGNQKKKNQNQGVEPPLLNSGGLRPPNPPL